MRLLCGDCLDLMGEIGDGSVDLILADLPYGTTRCAWDAIIPFDSLWKHYKRLVRRGGAIVLTANQPFTSALVMSQPKWFRHEWVWNKSIPTGFLDAKRRPLRDHESVLVFGRGRLTYNPQMVKGQRHGRGGTGRKSDNWGEYGHTPAYESDEYYPRTVLPIASQKCTTHPTQKPVALMEYLIRTYTNAGELVLDNAMGSGTTGVACLSAGRQFIGIERDRVIFATAERRIAEAKAAAENKMFAVA